MFYSKKDIKIMIFKEIYYGHFFQNLNISMICFYFFIRKVCYDFILMIKKNIMIMIFVKIIVMIFFFKKTHYSYIYLKIIIFS